MFGHGVHLPDLEPPRRAEEVETSKALAVVERGKPTNHEVAIFQPGPYAHYRATPAAQVPYPPRTNRNLRTPIEVQPLPTRKKIVGRVLAAAGCIGLIAVAALLWVRANTEDPGAYPKPAAGVPAARPIDLHPLAPPPPAAPAEPVPAPETAPPTQALAPRPPGAQPAKRAPAGPVPAKLAPTVAGDEETAAAPAAAKPTAAPPPPAHHTRPSRHHAAAAGETPAEGTSKPDQSSKPEGKPEGTDPKPAKGKRAVEDDPDATMAPTIE